VYGINELLVISGTYINGGAEIARPDIARPDEAAPYRKGGHRET